MKIIEAAFLTSIPAHGRLPANLGPTVAMVGRSNVGKSSFVNALTRRRVARAGAKPGTTRLVNLYTVHASWSGREKPRQLTLADLPGYGFARGGPTARREFETMTEQLFSQLTSERTDAAPPNRRWLAGVILLIDGRHPGLDADRAAYAWIRERGFPCIIATTKNDRMSRSACAKATRAHEQAAGGTVMPTSSRTGDGLGPIWTAVRALL